MEDDTLALTNPAYLKFLEDASCTLEKVLKTLEAKIFKNTENERILTCRKDQCFAILQEADPNEILFINVGGILMRMTRSSLNIFPNTRLAWLFNGKWDHVLPRDEEDNFFLDVDAAWVAQIFGSLSSRAEDKNFVLEPIYDSNEFVQDDTVGTYLCMEFFGLQSHFTMVHNFERRIEAALKQHYSRVELNFSGKWRTVRNLLPLEISTATVWQPNVVHVYQQNNKFYALLDWNRIEARKKGANSALLLNFSDSKLPLVENVSVTSNCTTGICIKNEDRSRTWSFTVPGYKNSLYNQNSYNNRVSFSNHSEMHTLPQNLMVLEFENQDCIFPQSSTSTSFSEELQASMTYLTKDVSNWVKQQEIELDSSATKIAREIELFEEEYTFISQFVDDISQAGKQRMLKMKENNQYLALKHVEKQKSAERIKIACKSGGAEICTNRSNFKLFKDSSLAVKYTSESWMDSVANDMDKNGCVIENHNHECFRKLINVMRMKALVRFPGYDGKYAHYCPQPVREGLRPVMSTMLKYFMIDEAHFFGPLNA